MARDRWRSRMTAALVVSLLLGLAGTGIGIEALRQNQSSSGPVTSIVTPATGATVSSYWPIVARPISPGVTAVDFLATGGTLSDTKVASAVSSYYGWAAGWNTKTVANGTYTLVAMSYDAAGQSARSSSVTVNVKN